MKAVAFRHNGGPDVLRVQELPDRHAGPGEIRIRVRAAAVSPADTLIRMGEQAARLLPVERLYPLPGSLASRISASRVEPRVGGGQTAARTGA